MSTSDNKKTLDTYNAKINEYIQGTTANVPKKWIDRSLTGLDYSSKIFEIGSGFGRDADYIESLGYRVKTSDAASGFVDLLLGQGKDAILFNALSDTFPKDYDMFIANAVLLHFNREEAREVCRKVLQALPNGGRFAIRLKVGVGEEWKKDKLGDDRYFCFWQETNLNKLLKEVGYSKVEIDIGEKTQYSQAGWLEAVAYK